MNRELRKIVYNEFGKDFFKLMNNAIFGKAIENVRKKRTDIKLVANEAKRNYLVLESNYHKKNFQKIISNKNDVH